MPKGLQRLTGLETLNYFIVGKPSNSLTLYGSKAKLAGDLADLGGLDNLKGELKVVLVDRSKDIVSEAKAANLDRKEITEFNMVFRESNIVDEMVLENLKPGANLKYLNIKKYGGRRLPCWMREGIHLWLPNLVRIEIADCKECINMCSFGRLPHLEFLKLERLDKVEYIEENGSNNKSDMVVLANECPSAPLFSSLTKIILRDIPELKGWWSMTESAQDCSQNQLQKSMPAFPKLVLLQMDMEMVISLAQVFLQRISSLQQLGIRGNTKDVGEQRCGLSNVAVKLRQPAILLKKYFPMLRCLWFLSNQMEHLPDEFRGMSSLTTLTLDKCEALEAVPEWIDTLTSLESLEILKCPRLKSLPHEISNLSNLKTLNLVGCSRELAERCQSPSGEDWPKIQYILDITIRPAKNEEE